MNGVAWKMILFLASSSCIYDKDQQRKYAYKKTARLELNITWTPRGWQLVKMVNNGPKTAYRRRRDGDATLSSRWEMASSSTRMWVVSHICREKARESTQWMRIAERIRLTNMEEGIFINRISIWRRRCALSSRPKMGPRQRTWSKRTETVQGKPTKASFRSAQALLC